MPRKISYQIVMAPYPLKGLMAPFPSDVLPTNKLIASSRRSGVVGVGQVLLSPILSKALFPLRPSDLILDETDLDFAQTGLETSSILRLHQFYHVDIGAISRKIGQLPSHLIPEVETRIRAVTIHDYYS